MAKRLVCVLGALSFTAAFPTVYSKSQWSPKNSDRKKSKVDEAIRKSHKLIHRLKNEVGIPGIVVGVSIDGEEVWKEGFGYADIENEVEAHGETVMRIASISKSLTAAVVARLWQEGVIDIDKPVQSYVPTFPEKKFGNEKVTITTRQLMCHLSGIRHYSKKNKEESGGSGDGQLEEFYSKEKYDTVEKALSIFKDDDLIYAPGTKFLYTTYGWTLVSAVMEGATGKTYPQIMRAFLRKLGMHRTYLDQPEPIIYGRSKCYGKNKNGRVINSPYVDNSCKWAGGGFLSTVGDLLKFSNALLYAFQSNGDIEVAKSSYKMVAQKSENKESKTKETPESEKNETLKTDKAGEIVSAGVSNITKGVVTGSNYVWELGSKIFGNENDEKGDSSSLTSKVSPDASADREQKSSGMKDEISESPEKGSEDNKTKEQTQEGGIVSAGVSNITKGVVTGSNYVWELASSIFNKENDDDAGNSSSKTSTVSSGASEIVSTGVSNITKGVVTGSNYVWGLASSIFNKENDDKGDSSSLTSKVTSGASALWERSSSWIWGERSTSPEKSSEDNKTADPNKEGGIVSAGVSNITKGVVTGSNYVWGLASSIFNKENDDKGDSSSLTSKVTSGASALWERSSSWIWGERSTSPEKSSEDNKTADPNKEGGIVSAGVSNITKGVVTGSNYVWGLASSIFNKENDDKGDSSSLTSKVSSGASAVWERSSSWIWGSEKNNNNESTGSIKSFFSSWFKPKAMSNEISVTKDFEILEKYATSQTKEVFWNDIVIPYAVQVVCGHLSETITYAEPDINGQLLEANESSLFFKKLEGEPYILPSTLVKLWTKVEGTSLSDWGPQVEGGYGLGFGVASPIDGAGGVLGGGQPYIIGHTGGAVGASSALIIVPKKCNKEEPPKGIAVVLLCNMQAVSLNPLAIEIAKIFSEV